MSRKVEITTKAEINKEHLEYISHQKAISNNPYLTEEQKKTALHAMEENFSSVKKANGNGFDYLVNKANSSSSSSPHSQSSSSSSLNINVASVMSTTTASSTSATITNSEFSERTVSPVRGRSNSGIKGLMQKLSTSEGSPSTLRKSTSGNSIIPVVNENKRAQTELYFAELVPIDEQKIKKLVMEAKPLLTKKDKNNKLKESNSNQPLIVITNRDMKSQQHSSDKTLIMIDLAKALGYGASTVVIAFDLLHRIPLAAKLYRNLSSPGVKAIQLGEIKNLQKRRWYFNFCKLEENLHVLLMKFIKGETLLREIYQINPKLSLDDIRQNACIQKKELSFDFQFNTILSFTEQLNKLHIRTKLLHRDLKPANIMISENGKVKIVDLGSAIPIETCTSEKKIAGTDPYIHPALWYLKDSEALGYEKAIDNLATCGIYIDIYAFAIICGEILAKRSNDLPNNTLQQKMPKIQSILLDVTKTEALLFSSKENLYEGLIKLHTHIAERFFLAGILDDIFAFGNFALENPERNFQQSIRIERQKAPDEKPMILTHKVIEFIPNVFMLEPLKIKEERVETYADFEKCLQNFILSELKLMAVKLLAVQPEDNCQFLLNEEAIRLRKIKGNYEMLTKEIKQLLEAPTQLETTVNKMYESSNGSNFFQPKEKFIISKSTHTKFKTAQIHVINGAIDKFKEIHSRKEEKSEFSLKQAFI